MAASGRLIPGVRKIAVLRANAIGDYVFCLPALTALRAAYPRADILLLGKPWHAELLVGRPGPIDRIAVVPEDAGLFRPVTDEGSLDRHPFFEMMRAERFDLALQLYGGGRQSNPFVRRLGAGVAVGMHDRDAEPLDRSLPFVYFQPEIIRYLEAVALAGAAVVTLEPRFAVTDADLDASLRVIEDDDRPLAVLNPGASDARRRWPVERFAAVGRALAREGARVVVSGDASERALGEELTGLLGGDTTNVAGRLSLHALVGLLSRAAVVVSNDTGPLHLGTAVGARTVGIFWAFNLANSSPILRMRHRPFAAWDPRCPRCGADNSIGRCEHDVSFVTQVPIDGVRDAALGFLKEAQVLAAARRPVLA